MHATITSQRGGLQISEGTGGKWNDIPARRPPPREARRPLSPTRSPWTIWITPKYQGVLWRGTKCSPTRTISTPRRRVFNPPSIAMINAPYLSTLTLKDWRETHNQRQALQIISQARNGLDQISNDLSQDSTDNLQIIGLPLRNRPLDIDVGEGSFGGENRAGDSGVRSGDGAGYGLKSGLSVGGGYVGIPQDQYRVGLCISDGPKDDHSSGDGRWWDRE